MGGFTLGFCSGNHKSIDDEKEHAQKESISESSKLRQAEVAKEVFALGQSAITPSIAVERKESEPVILLANRVRSVAKGLTSAGSTSYLEAYQLAAYALGLPWKEVVVKNVGGYLRVDALIGDQKVRVAARSKEIFLIFLVEGDFGHPLLDQGCQ